MATNPKHIILSNWQSPGDILMLTACVRDLHRAYPGQFKVGINTSIDSLWDNNPLVTKVEPSTMTDEWKDAPVIHMQYPLINQSNDRPYHFLHGFHQFLESKLNLRIPVTAYKADIYMTKEELTAPSPVEKEHGYSGKYWVLMAGGKSDYTTKWYAPDNHQAVINYFLGKIRFVQCGDKSHFHPKLTNVLDMVGKTSIREFIRVVYHAEGVICPVTFAMHLAPALPPKAPIPTQKPVVVIAGGREPPSFTYYNGHQYLSNVGCLPCSQNNGCWKSRCQLVGDLDFKDFQNLCSCPVQISPILRVPKCMMLITPRHIIEAVETWYNGGVLKYLGE